MENKQNKRKRKNPYVPGIAQISFKPKYDWEIDEAKRLYLEAEFSFKTDRIIYKDCIEGMKKLPKSSMDLIIADPPFGIKFNGKGSQYNRDSNLVIEGYKEIQGEYDEFTFNWISELPRIMKESSSAFIFSGWTNLNDVLSASKKVGLELINHIIWKYQFGVFTQRKFVTSHYHILFLVKNRKKYFFNKIEHYPLDIWDIPRTYRPGQKKNSTKLPENVVLRCINFCSKPGDIIFDPFMGNGTTAVCAKISYRHYFGFEINENMREIIENNIQEVEVGESYEPYYSYLPSLKELSEKYPHLKKYLSENVSIKKKEKIKQDLSNFL